MNTKIKIIFGLLALGTLMSVLSLFDYFNAGFASNLNLNNLVSKFSFAVETDNDKDGLKNTDESYWNTDPYNPDTDGDSFKDGEEVASGHDPNKQGPDDSLKDINLTQKLSELTVAGLTEGSLKPDNDSYGQSLATITDYIGDNSLFSLNRVIPSESIKIIDPGKVNQDEYLNLIHESIKNFLTYYGKEIRNINNKLDLIGTYGLKNEDVQKYFAEQEGIFKKIYNDTLNIEVPRNWKSEHLELLGEIKIAIEINRVITLGQADPVKAAMALNKLFEILDKVPDWTQKYIDKNRKEQINNQLIESLSK